MFKNLTPNIMVDDVNKTVEFYQANLGFAVVMTTDEDKNIKMDAPESDSLMWAMLKRDQTEIFFQKRESLAEELPAFQDLKMGGAFTLYFSVQDVKKLYAEIKDNLEIVKDLHKTFYGVEEFVVRDLNGLILYFGQAQNE